MIIGKLHNRHNENEALGREKIKVGINTRVTTAESFGDMEATVFYWESIKAAEESSDLIIGDFCSIAMGTEFFMGGNHRYDRVSTWFHEEIIEKSFTSNGDIIIGNDVWIGFGATIMSGITIGDGAVIAANANVVKNVEPYTIVGGNPAKQIKKRFSEEDIEFLLELKWWNWPLEKIEENKEILFSGKFDRTKLQKLL
jgi:virginiamycin A acetyltransferase